MADAPSGARGSTYFLLFASAAPAAAGRRVHVHDKTKVGLLGKRIASISSLVDDPGGTAILTDAA